MIFLNPELQSGVKKTSHPLLWNDLPMDISLTLLIQDSSISAVFLFIHFKGYLRVYRKLWPEFGLPAVGGVRQVTLPRV